MRGIEQRTFGEQTLPPITDRDLSALLPRVREYCLPPNVLPLAKDRTPFSGLPDEIIAMSIDRALRSSTRKGRFTDAIRAMLEIRVTPSEAYTVIEAHIDLTGVTPALLAELLTLGFEPDNFAEIQPPQYISHFTIQHIVPRESADKSQVFIEVRDAAAMAANAIDRCTEVTGYVETECYTARRIVRLPAVKLNSDELRNFPFRESTFTSLKVACTDAELGTCGYDSVEKRAADIHIKLASVATAEQGEVRLEHLLGVSGFYRIRSDAGNWMYSAHFSTLSDANMAFEQISAFAKVGGGITGVMREVCTSLWRKNDLKSGVPTRAEVPPHLRFRVGSNVALAPQQLS